MINCRKQFGRYVQSVFARCNDSARLSMCLISTFLCLLVGTNAAVAQSAAQTPPARSSKRVVAPNTTQRAFNAAAPAVVKLYGGGLGREHGYGTGTLVSADGKILTTLSLLTSRDRVRAVLADGRTFMARKMATDETRRLVMLKIEATDLPFLEMTDSTVLQPGSPVFALGNWFKVAEGQEQVSVTRGTFSMRMLLDARRLAQDYDYRGDALLFDAITSNPGAPGGPLVDLNGNCVGILGRIVEARATLTRINYALPAEQLADFIGGKVAERREGVASESAAQPYVGIRISRIGFRHVSPYVARVTRDSPADRAGIKRDDLVLMVGDRRISNASDYKDAIADTRPGDRVQFVIKRGDSLIAIPVEIGVKP